ncbi:MAG TPA: PIG-L family deacetylase [Opitutaceae bacterium]|nr:PIG-L family deacetylase [Opitutaceae bacterium]
MRPTSHFTLGGGTRAWLATVFFVFAFGLRASDLMPDSPPAIRQELKSFATLGSVLHIAAHPDDENTTLIAYLARGRGYRTAYLSVTRGDGGQNAIGPQFDSDLGVARTQELLAARRLDGGRQFFTRAIDFGYSKTLAETMRFWGQNEIVGDIVRVIRTFRPDVIVTVFAPVQQDGNHGQHNASALAALEAFKVAGDPKAFPEQLADGLTPWQPKRIVQGAGPLDMSGTDEVTGETFAAIASRSRAQHVTQLTDTGAGRGGGGRGGPAPGRGGPAPGGRGRGGSYNVLAGEPAVEDLMEGIDTTWKRVPNGGAEIAAATDTILASFKLDDPAASVPALLEIRAKLAVLPRDSVLDDKRAQLDRILRACLGLRAETTIPRAEVVPGETLSLAHRVKIAAGIPVRWLGVRYPNAANSALSGPAVALVAGKEAARSERVVLPATARLTQPYWLRELPTPGLYRVADVDRKLIGQPENPPAFPVEFVFEIGGQTLTLTTEPLQSGKNSAGAPRPRHLDVVPPVTVHFASIVKLLAPGATRPVEVELIANRADSAGTLQLDLPAGWRAAPASLPFRLGEVGAKAKFSFAVTAPADVGTGNLRAHVVVDQQSYANDRSVIDYDHIPFQLLQPPAVTRAVAVNLALKGKTIGYLPGAGDQVGECLGEMGYTVKELTGADLNPAKLTSLGIDTVVLGVRAFNEREDLAANIAGLYAWVGQGGTAVAQYIRPDRLLRTREVAPTPIAFGTPVNAWRVTDENSPVTILAPDHPAVTTPNAIGPADFLNWVQERGTYFPSEWDAAAFTPILAMNDPGEPPLKGSLLVARHGKGYYVFTSLGFFRQLPKGVPGAYRLFGNLVSLGK